ncbi:hypothetical protein BD779DRAFT_1673094 [Infundibulicybe gibba]|nr:hypothetical protein BD779DRAFT_1673094 [Infundibulicybe gibba]
MTCAGAGLGILRKVNFEIASIDEALQITEPCALIPLVKGIQRGILGDHVQLRLSVRKMDNALELDVSLFERLYRHHNTPGMVKAMLDVQYRSPKGLNIFPSREFYENWLQTSIPDSSEILRVLSKSSFT